MPGRQTVLGWLADDTYADFRTKYAYAREAQADHLAEEMMQIADTPRTGQKITSKEWGDEITEADMIEHRKLQVATRQWYAAKLAPKKYGDKQHVEMSGSLDLRKLSDAEIDEELAQLGAAAAIGSAQTDAEDDASDLI